jgi:hypothetical protein
MRTERTSPGVRAATRDYETWLASQVGVVKRDLRLKHHLVAQDRFAFLRATFYRWMQLWPVVCPEFSTAPRVLAVGDLHVENFGAWRDADDRLVWGVNDFDEAFRLPYVLDLVRLATSILVAIREHCLHVRPADACATVLKGYAESLKAAGRPIVLAERHARLRTLVYGKHHDEPTVFWRDADDLRPPETPIPLAARHAVESILPTPRPPYRMVTRTGGLGSLGRPRYVAITNWRGGCIGREVKALTASACVWAVNAGHLYANVLARAVRSPDPFLHLHGEWVARRFGPQSGRLDLAVLRKRADARHLLYAMGWETANIHLGTSRASASVGADLKSRRGDWLRKAAKRMARALEDDWDAWRGRLNARASRD